MQKPAFCAGGRSIDFVNEYAFLGHIMLDCTNINMIFCTEEICCVARLTM